MIRGIHHVALCTGDIDRLVAFYVDLLGFEVAMTTGWRDRPEIDEIIGLSNSAARQVMLRTGNAYLEIFEFESPSGLANDPPRRPCDRGYTHFCLDVADIDAEYQRLAAAGMKFRSTPSGDAGTSRVRAIYGSDPDGNIVELQEVLDERVPFDLRRTERMDGQRWG